jgi:hypothetical protein
MDASIEGKPVLKCKEVGGGGYAVSFGTTGKGRLKR